MSDRQTAPLWQQVMHAALTVVAVVIAVPAVMHGQWLLAVGAFVVVVVVEVVVLQVLHRRRRRKDQSGTTD